MLNGRIEVSPSESISLRDDESGRYVKRGSYESFIPSTVNHGWTWDDFRIHTQLEEATQAPGELNAFSIIVPDVDLFIQLHILKESNASSRIEGTRTEMDEAIRPAEEVGSEARVSKMRCSFHLRIMRCPD
ncbi:MAG: Fic/DOC family N-terminal domain-containing protein [Rhodothermales bacterium]